ncbi:MAG: type II toxin-antitoxin system PemK/MazF family toxin [Schleiferiaceae bacterium]|nr:type II toxin-antitoxin system PemK/MazF family toxin [Schleiferiaceae bacterium]
MIRKGDVLLIPFPFTDLSGSKRRPVVVLHVTARDLTVPFITTQLNWQEGVDLLLYPNDENGLKKASLVRLSKIATIDRSLAIGKLGKLSKKEIQALDNKLKFLFNLQ